MGRTPACRRHSRCFPEHWDRVSCQSLAAIPGSLFHPNHLRSEIRRNVTFHRPLPKTQLRLRLQILGRRQSLVGTAIPAQYPYSVRTPEADKNRPGVLLLKKELIVSKPARQWLVHNLYNKKNSLLSGLWCRPREAGKPHYFPTTRLQGVGCKVQGGWGRGHQKQGSHCRNRPGLLAATTASGRAGGIFFDPFPPFS